MKFLWWLMKQFVRRAMEAMQKEKLCMDLKCAPLSVGVRWRTCEHGERYLDVVMLLKDHSIIHLHTMPLDKRLCVVVGGTA